MRTYQYHCDQDDGGCDNLIEIKCAYADKDQNKPKSCSKCKKRKSIHEVFGGGAALFIHNTLGVLVDKNNNKISADEKHHLNEKHNAYKKLKNSEGSWVQTPDGLKHESQL